MVITSSFKIVLKHLHNAHNPLRLGIVGIEFERALDIMRVRTEIEFWQPRRCINSPGIGGAIILVGLNGLVESINSLARVFRGYASQVTTVQSAMHTVVGGHVSRWFASRQFNC